MMIIKTKSFEQLSKLELYRLMQLRQQVFVVEQDCPYLDLDDLDLNCLHVLGLDGEELIAYARILTYDIKKEGYTYIGRVIVKETYRDKKIGHQLMQYCTDYCDKYFSKTNIKISAQEHLEQYYNKHGFKKVGKMYLEDNIPHVAMIRDA